MITISVLGLDQFVVARYSKDNTANLAQLYECDGDEINFYCPNASLFHEGIDQTSWNAYVIVRAPMKVQVVEDKIASYLLKTLKDFSINVQIEFVYFPIERYHEQINEDYPRFIAKDNLVDVEEEEEEVDETLADPDANPRDRSDLDPDDPNQIFLGNALEGLEGKIAAKKASSGKKPAKK
ncbi:MAG: hypothetical protein LKK13_04075 [Bacilli bacterium]|jgi:hypothetical protein|nr:hypothetical protein [Bacilli bacterium]